MNADEITEIILALKHQDYRLRCLNKKPSLKNADRSIADIEKKFKFVQEKLTKLSSSINSLENRKTKSLNHYLESYSKNLKIVKNKTKAYHAKNAVSSEDSTNIAYDFED